MHARYVVGVCSVVFLLATALAGCLSGEDELQDEEDPGVSEQAGAVRGTVFDANLNPLGDANLTLTSDEGYQDSVSTEADGTYSFKRLPPGTYRLQATAVSCCREDVRNIEVQAGEVVVEDFMLELLTLTELRFPYKEGPHEWHGNFECVVGQANVCQNNERRHGMVLDPGVQTITVGMEWEPNPILGAQELELIVLNRVGDDQEIARQRGPPGFEIVLDDSVIEDESLKFQNYEDKKWSVAFEARAVDLDALLGQQFTIWWTFHYWSPAPDGFSTIPDR